MSISIRLPDQGPGVDNAKRSRANKIFVTTSYSQDGRNLESFWIDYNPDEKFALFLLEHSLNNSAGVDSYSVFDDQGMRITGFLAEHAPKRS